MVYVPHERARRVTHQRRGLRCRPVLEGHLLGGGTLSPDRSRVRTQAHQPPEPRPNCLLSNGPLSVSWHLARPGSGTCDHPSRGSRHSVCYDHGHFCIFQLASCSSAVHVSAAERWRSPAAGSRSEERALAGGGQVQRFVRCSAGMELSLSTRFPPFFLLAGAIA